DRVEAGGGTQLRRVRGRRPQPLLEGAVVFLQDLGEVCGQILDQLVADVRGQVGEGGGHAREVAVQRRLCVGVHGVHEVTPRSSSKRSIVAAKARQTLLEASSWARPAPLSA